MPQNSNLTKVRFRFDSPTWHGNPNEGLWAEIVKITKSEGTFRLMNSPFFAMGVSYHDIVRALPSTDGLEWEFSGVVEYGGHSTYMLLVQPSSQNFEAWWAKLAILGCTFESQTLRTDSGSVILYSVDVPDTADIYAVYNILEEGERSGVWDFQEGHVGHKLIGDPENLKQ